MTEIHLSEGEQFVLSRMDRLEDQTNERFKGLSSKVTTGFDAIHAKLDAHFEMDHERTANLRVGLAKVAVITALITSMLTLGATTLVTNQLKKYTVEQMAIVPPKQRGE